MQQRPAEGQVAVFVAVDHCNAECVGIHAARYGTRFEALDSLRQGVRQHLGAFAEGVATDLCIRHGHGSQYMSAVFAITYTPSMIRGIIRTIRALHIQCRQTALVSRLGTQRQ